MATYDTMTHLPSGMVEEDGVEHSCVFVCVRVFTVSDQLHYPASALTFSYILHLLGCGSLHVTEKEIIIIWRSTSSSTTF